MEELFGIFKEKYVNGIEMVKDIYQDKDIANYYNQSSSEHDEVNFYLNQLELKDRVLEIGTGNGRIFTPLLRNNINIYGIEPSKEMIGYIEPPEHRNRVFNFSLEEFIDKGDKSFNKIIIPATSISLFEPEEIRTFIYKYLKEIKFNEFTLIFDFINIDYFKSIDGKVSQSKIGNNTVYSANYLKGDKIFFNIYIKNGSTEKIGKSVKQVYNRKIIENIFENSHYSIQEFQNSNLIRMAISIRK